MWLCHILLTANARGGPELHKKMTLTLMEPWSKELRANTPFHIKHCLKRGQDIFGVGIYWYSKVEVVDMVFCFPPLRSRYSTHFPRKGVIVRIDDGKSTQFFFPGELVVRLWSIFRACPPPSPPSALFPFVGECPVRLIYFDDLTFGQFEAFLLTTPIST